MRAMVIAVILLFSLSASFAIGSNIFLFFFLRKKGLRPVFGLSGIPGYLDLMYARSRHLIQSRSLDILVSAKIASTVLAFVSGVTLAFLIGNR